MENLSCMYLRLSKEDGDNNESNSINNQRDLIKTFSRENNIEIVREYVDDGYSGSSFIRPAFKQMINDLNEGKFNTIIVKDLSRLGRDYIESGRYIQKIFPSMGVRFISINDNYDSAKANVNDTHLIVPIKNFINDSYCRDISVKVKSFKKMKQKNGEFIGSFTPFGYKKDPNNKYKLIIDKDVSYIIEKIFDMKIEGYSSKRIADFLNSIGYVTPFKHKENRGERMYCTFLKDGGKWDTKMINRIISNKVYIGILQQGKTEKLSYKSKKGIFIDEKDWLSKENAHEGIVSRLKFSLANKMLLRDLKGTPNILSGLLFCKYCGSQMIRRIIRNKNGDKIYYICSKNNRCKDCSNHKISREDILETTKNVIQNHLSFYEKLIDKINKSDIHNLKFEVDFEELKQEKIKYEHLYQSLYADLEEDLINDKEFKYFRGIYANKIKKIDNQIKFKQSLINELKNKIINNDNYLENLLFKNYRELNRLTLASLVDRIEIGKYNQINFVFNDYNNLNLLEEIVNKTTSLNKEVVLNG